MMDEKSDDRVNSDAQMLLTVTDGERTRLAINLDERTFEKVAHRIFGLLKDQRDIDERKRQYQAERERASQAAKAIRARRTAAASGSSGSEPWGVGTH